MSNIIIFNQSEIFRTKQYRNICYTEGLIKSLLIRGHNVKNIITNNYLYDPWCGLNVLKKNINLGYLFKKIKNFKPDLIISFNNSKLPNIEKEFECPIVIWEADKFYYFSDKYNLKKNSSRFFFFSSSLNGHNQFIKYFRAKKEKIFFLPVSTAIQSKIIKQDKNISFLGKLYDLPKINSEDKNYAKDNALFRKKILSSIQDFGLKIFTNEVPSFYKDLSHLCDRNIYNTIEDLEKIFNSSKISLNISHLQAKKNSISYRAIDIMASNSLLITEKSKYLEFFSKKLSRIFYDTPFDLRKKVKYFLENSNARKDIINVQNDITNKFFLWNDRVKDIEQIFNLKTTKINTINNHTYSKVVNEANKLKQMSTIKKNTNNFLLILLIFSTFKIFQKIKFIKIFFNYMFEPINNLRFSFKKKNIILYKIYKIFILFKFIIINNRNSLNRF